MKQHRVSAELAKNIVSTNAAKRDKELQPNQATGLMDPKVDFVFKSLFGDKKHPRILISFLNAVFGYKAASDKFITGVTIENPQVNKTMIKDKYSVLDVKATLNTEEIINIEMQLKNQGSMVNRMLFYLCKMFSDQLYESEYYDKLNRCVSIGVVDFDLIDSDSFHNTFNFRGKSYNLLLSNILELHIIELKKLARQENVDTNNLLVDWMQFLSNPESEIIRELQTKVPEIKEAMEALEMLSHDKKARAIYEERQKARWDKQSFLHNMQQAQEEALKAQEEALKAQEEVLKAREEVLKAREETAQAIAKELLGSGVDVHTIAKATHLTQTQIKKLKK